MNRIIYNNRKLQTFVSLLLCIAILMPSAYVLIAPKKVEAAGFPTFDAIGSALASVGNAFLSAGKFAWNQMAKIDYWEMAKKTAAEALKVVARKALAEMTKSTVSWINTGRFGKPFFIENSGSFFRDVTKTELKSLIGITGYDPLLYPFAKSYWLGVIGRYRQQLAYNSQESLYRVTNDPDLYRRDFGISGWEGLVNVTHTSGGNALYYHISADEDIGNKLQQTTNKITKTLDQGMGFLSLETCPSNPALDARNPLTTQQFDPSSVPNSPAYDAMLKAYDDALYNTPAASYDQAKIDKLYQIVLGYQQDHRDQIEAARVAHNTTNTCPGGWQTGTPGSVAANEIMKSLDIPEEHAWISSALGNSLTAIFDSLANKFLGKGLRYLSKQINNTVPPDNFNYYGVTLDNSTTSTSGWNNTLDEIIDLDVFKKQVSGKTQVVDATGAIIQEDIGDTCSSPTPPSYCSTPGASTYIPGAIINTALELRIIDDAQPSSISPQIKASLDRIRPITGGQNPGLLQVVDRMWPVAFNLDQCIPGPNKGWEKRLEQERDIVVNKLISETASDDQLKVRSASIAIKDLRFAVQGFKDWIQVKMFSTIPNGALYMDSVNSMDDTAQDLDELVKKRIEKITAVARLQSIESQLKAITVKPQPNTPQEKQLVNIWQQYNAASPSIASQTSLEDLQAQLDLASEKLAELRSYENDCLQERATAGWTGAGGSGGINQSLAGGTYVKYTIGTPSNGNGLTPFPYPIIGSEVEQFCSIPIISGYSHGEAVRTDDSMRFVNTGSFRAWPTADAPPNWYRFRNGPAVGAGMPPNAFDSGLPGYQDLPMVNAQNIYGDQTNNLDIVDADINCKYVFESSLNDYKHAGEDDF